MRALAILLALAALFAGGAWYLSAPYVQLPFSPTGSLTILTKPVRSLPPHTHDSTPTNADSILASGHGIVVESELYTVPEDVWITGVEVLTKNASPSVLHHLILATPDHKSEDCPERDAEIYTVGPDSKDRNAFPEPFGIYLKKGTRLYLSGMIHNPLPPQGEGGTYENVSIGYRFTTERPSLRRSVAVEFHRLALEDAPYCDDLDLRTAVDVFTVPAHAASFVQSSTKDEGVNPTRHIFKEDGIMIGFGAHLHPMDGGKRIDAYLNSEPIARAIPEQLDLERPWLWRTNFEVLGDTRVRAGDTLTFSATYDNPKDVPVEDAMGQIVFFFVPAK